jgi:hypothetical protein
MRIGLKVLAPFQQGTPAPYKPGSFVPEEQWQGWDATTLANRLANKWVIWEPLPDDGKDETADISVDELDKAGLVEFAQQRFGVNLDKRASVGNLREQIKGMLDREKQLALNTAKQTGAAVVQGKSQQAPRPGGSGAKVGATSTPAATPPAPPAVTETPAGETGETGDTGNSGNSGDTGGTDQSPPAGSDADQGAGTGSGDAPQS